MMTRKKKKKKKKNNKKKKKVEENFLTALKSPLSPLLTHMLVTQLDTLVGIFRNLDSVAASQIWMNSTSPEANIRPSD